MKVVGFSFIRNAIKFDYPIVEAIKSILPICDEFIIAVGKSEDNTKELILSINSEKIKIIDTIWDENLRQGGRVLADETDKAFNQISGADWAFYIQGDEVIHEKYLRIIKDSMEKWKDDKSVEGLLFNYTHFYGSYDYVGDSRRWYRKEIRILKPSKEISSYQDAQGFRINDRKLRVKPIDAWVYHYGWVKSPFNQQEKIKYFNSLWHDEDWIRRNIAPTDKFDYSSIDSLKFLMALTQKLCKRGLKELIGSLTLTQLLKILDKKPRYSIKLKTLLVGELGNIKIIKLYR
ncbi:MAG: hypothetical protein PHU35_03685 [Bacteroidales bacterium]|nr:hypothetical protein [Bacteroidales bacterium]